jgi:hypothetical protein
MRRTTRWIQPGILIMTVSYSNTHRSTFGSCLCNCRLTTLVLLVLDLAILGKGG